MAINLSAYKNIGTGLFVRLEVEYYKATAGSSPTSEILRFSDYSRDLTLDGELYQGIGRLLGITATTSEIRTSSGSMTVTLSGIPNSSIEEIVNSRIKGSPIRIYRAVFDSTTNQLLAITGNPAGRFFGIVNNYTIDEEFDYATRTSSNTLVLDCASTVDFLNNKVSARRTNPTSMKSFYSSDVSMDRVPNLVGANFNFGAPQ
jgi:hypothetical protein